MQLHVATRVDAGVYSYVGPLEGANVDGFLDGVHRFNQTTGRWGLYQSRRP